MPYYEFVWTDRPRNKIELNGVSPAEVEAIICDPWKVVKSRSSGRPLAMGFAEDGRVVACIYEMMDELRVIPVTAYFTEPKL